MKSIVFAIALLVSSILNAYGDQIPTAYVEMIAPAIDVKDRKLLSVLTDLHDQMLKSDPNYSKFPIIIDRHPNPPADLADELITLRLPAQSLAETVMLITGVSGTHCSVSNNGYLIVKTWHLGIFDPSPIFPSTNSEPGAAGQPATRSESK